ncbi:heme/hemin ABC transporter substrate-binding protein [Gordonia liuliyuniae]|uniref:ABC transporter substrate-binding protein n=1 Tax=Gordonia liuliyuniae TaxID=2911517 RepID=A0ABS9IRM2_9ACTN|nr:ABC transporter substrate-binding protein [Gordonia liuliyuniae]MCF8588210.1 ABC transporter substrate-binding protein [Gordonia liuliyuniae]
MVDSRRIRSLVAVAATALLTLVTLAGCTTEPIDTGALHSESTAPLRSSPTVAHIADADVVPVQTDPPVSPQSERIVALDRNGTLGTIVYALGLGPHVVGRDKSTTFPSARGVPEVTDTGHTINTERVLDTDPTIVLTGTDANPTTAVDALRDAEIDVVTFDSERSVATTPQLIRDVADALGVSAAGEKLVARTQQQIDAAKRSIPDPSGDPTIAFLYIRGEHLILMSGPDSGADDLIEQLGGVDAGTKAGLTAAFTQVSAEKMMRADPDVILVMTQGADSVGGMDKVLDLPAVAETKAGRAKRIVAMDETQILMFGPDTGQVLQALARAIYA